jgi:hypothetical protein
VKDLLAFVLLLPVYVAGRALAILEAGVRLLLVMGPFLAVGIGVAWQPGLSREVKDGVGAASMVAALVFLGWLAFAQAPPAGARPSLRYRYARLMGMGRPRR